jgi:hypothetical protein
VLGVLLVLGGALAFADVSLHQGTTDEVLEVSQPLSAGQIVQSSDLAFVRVSAGTDLSSIPVSDEASMVGRPAAIPLVAGALLTRSEVGAPSPVDSGSDVVALGLKSGQYPPDLVAGDQVQVVLVGTSSGSGGSGASAAGNLGSDSASASSSNPISATVLNVDIAPTDSDNPTVFSLQVGRSNADEVATWAAAGDASLVQLGTAAK